MTDCYCSIVQVICTGSYTPSDSRLPRQFPVEAPFVLIAFITCVTLGILIERQKYKSGIDDQKQSLAIKNQKIPNQESIIGNLLLLSIYLLIIYVVIKMNKQVYMYKFALTIIFKRSFFLVRTIGTVTFMSTNLGFQHSM